ncbi:hypothetical protein MRS45_13755 [Pseudomonas viridiflava]|uniref:hypothetical protein n=2 Tax=Pseudomonas viridiflava TaxID=33069 RepID=UPI001FD71B55|nr:hypothetical protein [Pseudomonas viridiflava]MCJ8177159.1 hypothetical protein [Pseudomonas viridiflava]
MVNSISTNSAYVPPAASATKAASASAPTSSNATSFATGAAETNAGLSSLSRQLSESATRAASRDSALTRQELSEKAAHQLSQIAGPGYDANKARNNAEAVDSYDPERLARAEKATRFVSGGSDNPFAGMPRSQLALIAYDDSDTFTVNEKRAAFEEDFQQESQWRQQFAAKAMAEYNATGKLTNAFTEALQHFKGLPAIEQAQYPEDYEAKLQGWIDLDFNYRTHTAEGKGGAQRLFSQLLKLDKNPIDESTARADTRDKSLSRQELSEKARQVTEQLIGRSYDDNKARHDAEVPDSIDPDRLERAKEATRFTNGSGTNPFAGMSREQLSVIAYDEGGDFTVNEKKAAWLESYHQETIWRQKVVAQGSAEYSSTGKLTQFFTSVLDHYKALPAIEQSTYDAGYETRLQAFIDLDFNYWTHTAEGKGGSAQSLLEKFLKLDDTAFDQDTQSTKPAQP